MTCVAVVLVLTVSITYSEVPPKSSPYSLYPLIGGPPYPSYPAGPPNMLNQGSDSIPISSGMFRDSLPLFTSMEYGFLYESSSKGYKRSQFFANFFLPILETRRDVWFCQAQYGYNGFSSPGTYGNGSQAQYGYNGLSNPGVYGNGSAAYREDVSVGGGYRFFLNTPSIIVFGFNSFWDVSRIYGSWWSSWGVGLEMVVSTRGSRSKWTKTNDLQITETSPHVDSCKE